MLIKQGMVRFSKGKRENSRCNLEKSSHNITQNPDAIHLLESPEMAADCNRKEKKSKHLARFEVGLRRNSIFSGWHQMATHVFTINIYRDIGS